MNLGGIGGTDWVSPGVGETIANLIQALERVNVPLGEVGRHLRGLGDPLERTNVRLTGQPLTQHDLDRMMIITVALRNLTNDSQ